MRRRLDYAAGMFCLVAPALFMGWSVAYLLVTG